MAEDRERRDEFLIYQGPFKTNAWKIINQMVAWCKDTEGSKHLVDEILHSIFFLGKINNVPFSPEKIIPDESMFNELKEMYPLSFECYTTHLPKRSPFSCVLDMNVLREGPENEDSIRRILHQLSHTLKPRFLVSTTICVSKSNKSVKQYGVSMSTTKVDAGRIIIIAASCLSGFWDEYIAGAVMTYYPEKKKKAYFDGTIKVPTDVSCKAYSIRSKDEIQPCKLCGNLFGFHPHSDGDNWPYGNCAEVESLSKLFKIDPEVKNRAQPESNTCTPENRERARVSVLKHLRDTLRTTPFNETWNGYYTPQTQ